MKQLNHSIYRTGVRITIRVVALFAAVYIHLYAANAQGQASISIDLGARGPEIPGSMYGLFFEEINHAGEGGLFGELIQNRGFEESRVPPACTLQKETVPGRNGTTRTVQWLVPPRTPHYDIQPDVSDWRMPWPVENEWPAWNLETTGDWEATLALTHDHPLHAATPNALQVTVSKSGGSGRAAIVNEGFWGINVEAGKTYDLRFFVRSESGYRGPFTVTLESPEGAVLAAKTIPYQGRPEWTELKAELTAVAASPKARFVLAPSSPGTFRLDFVSLFPRDTFKGRPNGLRKDLAQRLADLKPAFIRWPGGCFLEGITVQSAHAWKRTIGDPVTRPGTYSPWGYWSTDGLGYHEFLQFSEDVGAAALYVFNVGVSCTYRSGTFVPDDSIGPYIQDALDAIEYALGPVDSKWGKLRAENGHPAPFPLKYVEVGNEQIGARYGERFNHFYRAIKEKYPELQVIASMGIAHEQEDILGAIDKLDVADEHAYKSAMWPLRNWDWYDRYDRSTRPYTIYVGEYATNSGVGTGNLYAALNDAVFLMGVERNSDLVRMASYAPLMQHQADRDWPVNLIEFDSHRHFVHPSYYVQHLFANQRPDVNLKTTVTAASEADPEPRYAGGIGLMTWNARAAFKDLQVVQDGKIVYASDFKGRPAEWKVVSGQWSVAEDGTYRQTGDGPNRIAWLDAKTFGNTYTVTFKTNRTGTADAVIFLFGHDGKGNYYKMNYGGWGGGYAALQRVWNDRDTGQISEISPANLGDGAWHDVRIDVGRTTIDAYMDGRLVMHYEEPPVFFALAGYDEARDEVVVKVVNAGGKALHTKIDLKGAGSMGAQAQVVTLSGPSPEVDNSLDQPDRVVPETSTIVTPGASFETTFAPWSFTLLRFPAVP